MDDATHRYLRPPIWEIGLSVHTADGPFFDPYHIESFHNIFRAELPRYERHVAVDPISVGPPAQIGSVVPVFVEGAPPTRWWFVSEDDHALAQFQERFTARNWRRKLLPPLGGEGYPGYEAIRNQFREQIAAIEAWHKARDASISEPTTCEILYDNLIPIRRENGDIFRTQDVFAPLNFAEPVPMASFNMGWGEQISVEGESAGWLHITMNVVGAANTDGEVAPFVKLMFVAKSQANSWDAAFNFFDHAHGYIAKRFAELVSPECRATWGPQ